MKIELTARWLERNNDPEDLENLRLKRIIEGEEDEEIVPLKYVYGPIVIEATYINSFNKLDEEHTIVRMSDVETYCIKIPFPAFTDLYSKLTGETIMRIEEIKSNIKDKKRPAKLDKTDLD